MSKLRLRATPVGDALLVHPKGHIDARAAGFAGGLSRDPHHTLVVVDLPAGVLADEWPSVAKVLSSSRYRSLRMVFGRDKGEDVRTAAGLIAERLGREVLAPDGTLVPTVAGGLFVPGDGAAWLRFRPGHTAEPDSQRFPKPQWEFSLPTRARAVGAQTTAQPVPAGVWLRHTDRNRLTSDHRNKVETVPTDPHRLLVVLGSPDMPPLAVDDVARYWDSVLPSARSSVRFYLYGTLDTPESLAPGQCLADSLDHEVVLYAELPSGIHAGDGSTLAYVPAQSTSHLGPAHASTANGTQHAAPPPTANTTPQPYEPQTPSTGTPSPTVSAALATTTDNELGTNADAAGVAGGSEILTNTPPSTRSADTATPPGARSPAQPTPPRVPTVSVSATPPTNAVRETTPPQASGITPEPTSNATTHPSQDQALSSDPVASDNASSPTGAPHGTTPKTDPEPEPEPGAAPDTDTLLDPPPGVGSTADHTPESRPARAEEPSAPRPELQLAPRPVRPAAPRFRLESSTPAPEPDPTSGTVPARPPSPTPPRGEAAQVQVQPVPKTAACALPPERGIAREREWLRRMFSEQYNDTAGSISRIMSETPGLRGGSKTEAAEALTELVAVRLYLSGDHRGADAAVRTATAGPHVPLARCVTAGLRKLPSYRGPALLRTRLTEAERSWYQEGRLVTEWAFCHARTSLHTGPRGTGATDILIWSMTARRTTSLDPALADRVLFLPGSAFKVLRMDGNTLLMREVSPSEIAQDGKVDAPQVRLDEVALKGMENILDSLEKAGTDATAECADPPGLIVNPNTGRPGPTQGAKP
ncbi:hypothetical protein OG763_44725 (plasmid) [Streptomyces sp. NBC_01230]|uniref:hypothetical protein n=1 Tax=unclassified Streptomyces TaxID=2593676 RepID=UPI002E10E276|nr:hypothetical protein OG763_44725 [Streptomyces sp. NBC_01230]